MILILEKKLLYSRPEKLIQSNCFDIKLFKEIIEKIKAGNKEVKRKEIEKLISLEGLISHEEDKQTKRKVISNIEYFDYGHEKHTAIKLIRENYDVIFAPKGYFKRSQKRFDIFIARDHVLFESELKCIHSINPDTIGNRIKEGSDQASRIILDIHSDIDKKNLITGLKTGCERNESVIEILLFYNGRFYCLPKNKILSKKIFDSIK